ncbi:hypothetical protein H112_08230 [Trichophyton rubrum D6]|uniref:Uncharacterized protein n=3 Tax=Trichophyton rubrum TaxID=5551 RepID=A0A178ETY7_TRIRU|nr:uncharacterized protein TERG_00801 [Trichophyton rubrum CBS 118892]EZF10530.1 hypothetical protein H100_08254 [Trichophyton rubrum MR850]EZF37400.1 hypothetical protein H102_08211 [Trichophyton rubrum CBS 100081]EZF48039.1 hypothetical protein H103_08236 [Trichophyton rubrum CBS 288.86]EZF58695.1 hypothetical protein H104_08187 [Trichophyton rubrum CBS 289.86]EZF79970.1 hypothetical protein H110_08234 [Trichophyton rubrum MR1448]EZF90610.1 hypothetical protein H113_08303 [Trichophyton rubr
MASTVPLMIAIYDNPGIKHWSLFIDAEEKPAKTIIHLLGARQRYFRDVRTPSDARNSASVVELCALCEIDASKIETIKNIAWETPVRNEEPDYSCQDFVLDVLEGLERADIVDAENPDYQRNKGIVKAKREAWK